MSDPKLTELEKDEIAELAAQKAYDRFYLAVWIVGASAFACWLYFQEGTF